MKYQSLLFISIAAFVTASGCWLGCSELPEYDMVDSQLESTNQALGFSLKTESETTIKSQMSKLSKTCDRYIMRPRTRTASGECPLVWNWTGSDLDSSDDGFCYYAWNGTDINGPSSGELERLAAHAMRGNPYATKTPTRLGTIKPTGLRVSSSSNLRVELSPSSSSSSSSSFPTEIPAGLHSACSLASPDNIQHFSVSTMGILYADQLELSCVSGGYTWEDGKCWDIVTLSNGHKIRVLITFVHPFQNPCGTCIHVFNRTMTAVGLPAGSQGYISFDDGQAAAVEVPENAQEVFSMPLDSSVPMGDYWVGWVEQVVE